MKTNSLAFRLMLSSAAWTVLILSITAAILISLSRGLIEESFDQRLNQYLEYLIAKSAQANELDPKKPDSLGEPLFAAPLSGIYWQIRPIGKDKEPLFKSESLVGETFETPTDLGMKSADKQPLQAYVEGPDGQVLRVVEREITFTQGDDHRSFSYSVAFDSAAIDSEISDFANSIVLTLALLGVGLLVATFFQVRFGLSPLRDVSNQLAAIRSGDAAKLEGVVPAEIEPLQNELNALIQANYSVVERARTHVGNLAHALKTPLSVIMNEAGGQDGDLAFKVKEQAEIMRQQVTHYLDRARIAGQIRPVVGVTNVSSELRALSNALTKIYAARALKLDIDCPPGLKFLGEKQDFEEMAGNLLDNAFKWARSRVVVRAETLESVERGETKQFQLVIEDDGKGLPEDFRKSAVKRGQRLDESVPGSGLGLSIVADLSHLYRGSLNLEEADSGGLRARLILPAA